MNSPRRAGRWLRWWVVGYVVLVSTVVGAMFWARHSMVPRLATAESISEWQTWQASERERQSRPGPVEHRVPRSDQPPALVLLRDYFTILIVGALLFSSMLYWIIAWFVTGILNVPREGEAPAELERG